MQTIVSLALLSVFLGMSLGGMDSILHSQSGEKALEKIAFSIRYARSEAVKNAGLVTICRSSDGSGCSGSWQQGHIVFTDINGDGQLNQNDRLLLWVEHNRVNGSIRWRAFQNRQYLQMTSLGFTRYQNGNFTFCPVDGDSRKIQQLVVNRAGRLRYAKDADGDGRVDDSRGRPVNC
ncbi:MAG: GspH/FimT family protein [Pseudohongiellaceae bacterium]